MWLGGQVKHALAAAAAVLTLAACDSPEERAEKHYQQGVELAASGDLDRAALEFRNALQEDSDHTEARLEYAGLLRAQGNIPEAISQYLRLVEEQPENLDVQLALAQMSLDIQDFQGVEQHTDAAFALAPSDLDVRALKASVEFRRGNADEAVAMAEAVLADAPASVPAHMVVIADQMAASDFAGALEHVDTALAAAPESEDLHLARLTALDQLGEVEEVGAQLERMAEIFPSNDPIRQTLLRWYASQGDTDAAVAILRQLADEFPEAPEGYLAVAQFLLEAEGSAAARAELERLIAAQPDSLPFRRALAQLDFAEGRRDAAVESLRSLTEGEESTPAIRDLQITLAQMLAETGDAEESAALVDAVLAADARDVAALKMRARRLIDQDRTEDALRDLQTAATDAPRDAEVMTLMAMAHEREGAQQLVGERLARAVEASEFGADESLRYAQFLIRDGRHGPAESTLLDALRRAPQNGDLLLALAQVHLERQDWTRARQVAGLLRDLGEPAADAAANSVELASLQGEGRMEDMVAMLEGMSTSNPGDLGARLALVQRQLAEDDLAGAEAEVNAILAEDPGNPPGRMMLAGLHIVRGATDEAETIYRDVIAEHPSLGEPYQLLASLMANLGRTDEALAVLDQGIEATGRHGALLNAKAGLLYAEGDFEASLALFEELYARNTGDIVMANNLASLLSTVRTDEASLERAFQVGRRLRGTEVPQFQDTYGWILVLRGDYEQALTYLEPAAAALSEDPLVQFHLGMAHLGVERWDDARTALARAVDLAGASSSLPQFATAREKIAEIETRRAAADEPPEG